MLVSLKKPYSQIVKRKHSAPASMAYVGWKSAGFKIEYDEGVEALLRHLYITCVVEAGIRAKND